MSESKWWRKPDGTLCYGTDKDCLSFEINQKTQEVDLKENINAPGCDREAHKILEDLWRDPKTKLKLKG